MNLGPIARTFPAERHSPHKEPFSKLKLRLKVLMVDHFAMWIRPVSLSWIFQSHHSNITRYLSLDSRPVPPMVASCPSEGDTPDTCIATQHQSMLKNAGRASCFVKGSSGVCVHASTPAPQF